MKREGRTDSIWPEDLDHLNSVPKHFVQSLFLAKKMSKIGDTGCKSTRYPMSGQSHVSLNGAMPKILFYFSRTHPCSRPSSTRLTTKDILKKSASHYPFSSVTKVYKVFKASKVFKARKASKVKMAATEETGETERRLVKK